MTREVRVQKLLVSIRGPNEAMAAVHGGALIADVEYPVSALGTSYPLNIQAVKEKILSSGQRDVLVSTNIGEVQSVRASACQAALGVATAGADLIKFGLAELPLEAAAYLGETIVRTVRKWFPEKKLFPAVFIDSDLRRYFDPLRDGLALVNAIQADGLLIDTYNKLSGEGLLDLCSIGELERLARELGNAGKEAWFAGSITLDELPKFWKLGANVVCVRGAACAPGKGNERFGEVNADQVRKLVNTIPLLEK